MKPRTAAILPPEPRTLEILDKINLNEQPEITTVQRVIFTMFHDAEPQMLRYLS